MDEKYFVAKITIDMVDSESGKIKKQREEKKNNVHKIEYLSYQNNI